MSEGLSLKAIDTIQKVHDWVEHECIPAELIVIAHLSKNPWKTPASIEELRKKAKAANLFNLFLLKRFKESPVGLTNLEYSCCAELMGRVYWAAQTMNRHAPETGNIELLAKYCNEEQKEKPLRPLMNGEFSSACSMSEFDRASSDATNIACRIECDGGYGNTKYNKDIKLAAHIIDECMQLYGGQALTQHMLLPELWTYACFVRIADGSDTAHRHQVGRDQLKTAEAFTQRHAGYLRRARELGKAWGIENEEEREWEYILEPLIATSSTSKL